MKLKGSKGLQQSALQFCHPSSFQIEHNWFQLLKENLIL